MHWKAVIDRIKAEANRVAFNNATSYRSVTAEMEVGSETIGFERLWTGSEVIVSFAQLELTDATANLATRRVLV